MALNEGDTSTGAGAGVVDAGTGTGAAVGSKPADGGGDTVTGTGKEKIVFTKEQQDYVNKLLAENKRGLRADLEKTAQTLTERDRAFQELAASHQEVVDFLNSLQEDDEDGKKPIINVDGTRDLKDIVKDMAGKLTESHEQIATYEQRFGELEGKLETEAALREIAEEEGLIAERDALVQRALISVGCTDIKVAMKLFEDNIEVDEETGQWFVVDDETKEEWPLKEGVAKLLPDYMKKPLTGKGGAGSTGSKDALLSDVQTNKAKLSEIDGEIASLKAEYLKTRNQSVLTKVQQLVRKKSELARQLRNVSI